MAEKKTEQVTAAKGARSEKQGQEKKTPEGVDAELTKKGTATKTTARAKKTKAEEKKTAAASEYPKKGRVVDGNLNIRQGQGMEYGKVGILMNGSEVTLLKDCGGWFEVPGGYVMSRYVEIIGDVG